MATYQTVTPSDRLLMTLFFAGVLHTIIIFGVSFDVPKPAKVNKSLEIVLVSKANLAAPEKADYLAQENQLGSGRQKNKTKPPVRAVQQQRTVQQPVENRETLEQAKVKPIAKVKKALTQDRAKQRVLTQNTNDNPNQQHRPKITATVLSKQITQLGAEITKAYEKYSKRPKIKYINSVNAHKYKAASYERAWQEKVERIGNLNYPEEARRKNLSGSLLLSVGIYSDGTIHSIKVNKSSGHKALDDAAVRIVRLAGPYAPFPKELTEEAEVLVITRTWKFFKNDQMTTGP